MNLPDARMRCSQGVVRMSGFLLDTNAWIGLLKGHPMIAAGVGRAGIDALFLCAPVWAELWFGACKSMSELLRAEKLTLARANLQKFLIRKLIEARISVLRKQAAGKAFQQTLFAGDSASRIAVSEVCVFDFQPQAYAPSRDYDGRFGHFDFRKHYYGRLGDFDSAEEFACACWLDTQAQKGRIRNWVRNLVRREGCSFFLQKADGRFYPDFLCELPTGVVLAVENKGADRWTAAADDRLIGGLWADLSDDRCRFVMVREKRWDAIEALLS